MNLVQQIKELIELGYSKEEARDMVMQNQKKNDAEEFYRQFKEAEKAEKERKKKEREEKEAKIQANRELGKGSRDTDPIETEDIEKIFVALKDPIKQLFFLCGIYLGLRGSDLIRLQVKHFRNNYGPAGLPMVDIIEKKTKKPADRVVPEELMNFFNSVIGEDVNVETYIFQSREKNEKAYKKEKETKEPYISRQTAYRWIKDAAVKAGVIAKFRDDKFVISVHSLRKTWGILGLESGMNEREVRDMYNHSNSKITDKYLKISKKRRQSNTGRISTGISFKKEGEA